MTLMDVIDKHLQNLDAVEITDNCIFKSENNKERYESYIMFAYRKFSSLEYHLRNTHKLIDEEVKNLLEKELGIPESELRPTSKIKFKIEKHSFEYAFELSAFLESLKSCIDLLAELISYYLKGKSVNYSISPLLKLIKKQDNILLSYIRKNEPWISLIRDYRHPLVHRLALTSISGHEIRYEGGKIIRVLYPVLIPKSNPIFLPDTRTSRSVNVEEYLGHSIYSENRIEQTFPNGTKKSDIFISIEPQKDYIEIEKFMDFHIKECERYFKELISLIDRLKFEYIEFT